MAKAVSQSRKTVLIGAEQKGSHQHIRPREVVSVRNFIPLKKRMNGGLFKPFF